MAAKKKATKKTSAPAKAKVLPGKQTDPLIPTPEVGEFVNFFPGKHDAAARTNNTEKLAAVVTNTFTAGQINLRVFQDGNDNPLWRTSIKHISVATKEESCWDFR